MVAGVLVQAVDLVEQLLEGFGEVDVQLRYHLLEAFHFFRSFRRRIRLQMNIILVLKVTNIERAVRSI